MKAIYILFALALAFQAQAEFGMEEWVYTSDDGYGLAYDIEVDNQGYVYATGRCGPDSSHYDFFTVKLDNNGNEVWFVTYNGPADGKDYGLDLVVDSDGSVYVTGNSKGNGTDYDICTIKYDLHGNEEWVRRYDGPAHYDDQGRFITLTDAGDIVVAGATVSSGTDWDFFVGKYNADGDEIWTADYDGPAGKEDYIFDHGLVTDEYGNIYVTGASDGIDAPYGDGHDYCTIKYDSDGGEEWVVRYDGPLNRFDRPSAGIAMDSDGNVLVSGYSDCGFSELNACTIKYDNDGNELWTAYYEGTGSPDWPYDIAVDEYGDVYITGITWLSFYDFESLTIKYDGDGNEIWVNRGDFSNTPSLTLDEYGMVYVCGDIQPPDDARVVKYGPENGDTQWIADYDGSEGSFDGLVSITTDDQGNIFACGICNMPKYRYSLHAYPYPQSAGDMLVVKYSHTVSVELLRFSATPRDERITLAWEVSATENENVEGFNLYRREVTSRETKRVTNTDGPAEGKFDDWTKINAILITGANPYLYADTNVEPGVTYEYRLEAVVNGTAETLGTTTATTGAGLPTSYALYQSRPNPASGIATIAFDLPEDTNVTLTVYDISGRKVTTVVDRALTAGEHEAEVSGLAPGVYVYRLYAGDFSASKKMVVVD